MVLPEAYRTWPSGSACCRTCSGRLDVCCVPTEHPGGMEVEGATHPPCENAAWAWPVSSHSSSWISDINFYWFAPKPSVNRTLLCPPKMCISKFLISFIFARNTWPDLTSCLILFPVLLLSGTETRESNALLLPEWLRSEWLPLVDCALVLFLTCSVETLPLQRKWNLWKK